MNNYIKILLSLILTLGLLVGTAGRVFAQKAEDNQAVDALQLGIDSEDISGDFKAFARTETCLQVIPGSIRSARLGRLGLIVISGREFQKGEMVDWGTYDIITIMRFRFPNRIFSIVWIVRNAEEGTFDVMVGDDDNCTGEITIVKQVF